MTIIKIKSDDMSKASEALKLNFTPFLISANQIQQSTTPFLNVFHFNPDDYYHRSKGSLFGLIQVDNHHQQLEYLPNLLISIIKKEFYNSSWSNIEDRLENALRKVNLALTQRLQHETSDWLKQFSALIAAFQGNRLYFSQAGNGLLLFCRQQKLQVLSSPNNSPANPVSVEMEIFSDLTNGQLLPGDKLFITNLDFYHYWQEEKKGIDWCSANIQEELKNWQPALPKQKELGVLLIQIPPDKSASEVKLVTSLSRKQPRQTQKTNKSLRNPELDNQQRDDGSSNNLASEIQRPPTSSAVPSSIPGPTTSFADAVSSKAKSSTIKAPVIPLTPLSSPRKKQQIKDVRRQKEKKETDLSPFEKYPEIYITSENNKKSSFFSKLPKIRRVKLAFFRQKFVYCCHRLIDKFSFLNAGLNNNWRKIWQKIKMLFLILIEKISNLLKQLVKMFAKVKKIINRQKNWQHWLNIIKRKFKMVLAQVKKFFTRIKKTLSLSELENDD